MKELIDKLRNMVAGLVRDGNFSIKAHNFPHEGSTKKDMAFASLAAFYEQTSAFSIEWQHKKYPDSGFIKGQINILSPDKVYGSWDNVIWFSDDESTKDFRPLDFFVPEACVGFYDKTSDDPEMYLLKASEKPKGLGINFRSYLELLELSRGYYYWPAALYSHKSQTDSLEIQDFRQYMPELFPGFDADAFFNKYDSLISVK